MSPALHRQIARSTVSKHMEGLVCLISWDMPCYDLNLELSIINFIPKRKHVYNHVDVLFRWTTNCNSTN